MANDKAPRSTSSKSASAPASARKTVQPVNRTPATPIDSGKVSPGAGAGTQRNPVVQGAGTVDHDKIRQRAYQLYEQRGRQEGFHEEDWLRAEKEIRSTSGKKRSA